MGVLEVPGDELVPDQRRRVQRVLGFRHHRPPVRALGLGEIDRDDAVARRVIVGLHVQRRTDVPDEAIARMGIRDNRRHGRTRNIQLLHQQGILDIGPMVLGNDQVLPVVGHPTVDIPVLIVHAPVDCRVLGLLRPEAVEKQCLVLVLRFERFPFRGWVVAGVKEAAAVLAPRSAGELDVVNLIRQILTAGDIFDPPYFPVRSGFRKSIGHQSTVIAVSGVLEGHGPVLR
jgi:hypothetical protein